MNSREKKIAEALVQLGDADRARLAALAALAGLSAEAIWPDVWANGFEDTEESVKARIEAEADIAAGRTIPNEEVMADMWRIVNSAKLNKKAG
jgi:predicted transcriptional regulator